MLNNDAAPTLGEVAVSPDYVPVVLPSWLVNIRAKLFGTSPDRAMLNYRLAQLMPLIALTGLQEYVVALDPRLTYGTTAPPDLFNPANYVPQISTDANSELFVVGSAVSPDQLGQIAYSFTVSTPGDSATVTVTSLTTAAGPQLFTPAVTDGLFAPVPLGETGYSAVVPVNAGLWTVSGYAQPTWTLGQLNAYLHTLGEDELLQLFGLVLTEPYLTFSNCFNNHPELSYQLGGLVLAVAYQTNVIWQGA